MERDTRTQASPVLAQLTMESRKCSGLELSVCDFGSQLNSVAIQEARLVTATRDSNLKAVTCYPPHTAHCSCHTSQPGDGILT